MYQTLQKIHPILIQSPCKIVKIEKMGHAWGKRCTKTTLLCRGQNELPFFFFLNQDLFFVFSVIYFNYNSCLVQADTEVKMKTYKY